MKSIIAFLLVIVVQYCHGQASESPSISFRIDSDSVFYTSSSKSLTVPVTIYNLNSEKVILYALTGTPMKVSFELSEFCDTRLTMAGVSFGVYRLDGTQHEYQVTIYDLFDRKPPTVGSIDSIRKRSVDHLLRTKMQLAKNESASFVKEIVLEDFKLEPGIYSLQLIYFCGAKILNFLEATELTKNQMYIFQGCAMSNRIPLVVK